MAKKATSQIGRCPECGATHFQGPYQRGTLAVTVKNGKVSSAKLDNVIETVWQCMGGNHVIPVENLAVQNLPDVPEATEEE